MPKDSEIALNPRPKGCSCLTIGIVIAIPLMATFFFCLTWLLGRNSFARSRLQQEIKKLEAQGSPYDDLSHSKYHELLTSAEDPTPWVAILDKVHSKEYFKEIIVLEKIKRKGGEDGEDYRVPVGGLEWPDEEEFRSFLERWSETRSAARSLALQGKKVRFPIKFDSYNNELANTRRIQQLARLFALEAQVAIRDRDSNQAAESIRAILGCSTALQGEPFLISQFSCYTMERMAWNEIRSAIEEDVLEIESLRRILLAIESRPSISTTWKQWVNGERAWTLPVFTNSKLQKYLNDDKGLKSAIAIPAPSSDALLYLEIMQRAEEMATDDIDQLFASAAKLDNDVKNIYLKSTWAFDRMITGSVTQWFHSIAHEVVTNAMQARLASLAIGIRIYQKERGEFPTGLDDLEKIGINTKAMVPIGTKPFGYLVEENEATLWGFPPRTANETPDSVSGVRDAVGMDRVINNIPVNWIWSLPIHE